MSWVKWIVAVLVGLNVGIFIYMKLSAPGVDTAGDDGRLPRVAEIELIGRAAGTGSEGGNGSPRESAGAAPAGEARAVEIAPAKEGGRPRVGMPAVAYCTAMGWFDDEAAALSAAAALPPALAARMREAIAVERALDDFYWVLIPPLADRAEALQRSRELSAQGIESYAVPSGEHENGISLGLFRSRTSAEQILAQRTEQNIEARLVILPRNRISYALVFEGALELIEIPEDALSLGENGQWIRIESGDCESVASTRKNP